jgi:flagellar hook-associated protein 2
LLQQQLLSGLNVTNPNGSLSSVPSTAGATLSGSLSIQIGNGSAQTVSVPNTSGDNTLAGLAGAINAAGLGVTASITTANGESTLSLDSATAGAAGALTVQSTIQATTPTALRYSDPNGYTGTTADTGTLSPVSSASDALSGSITMQVGSGTATTINVPASSTTSPTNNLAGLAGAINAAALGVTASVVTSNGVSSLQLASGTTGSTGALTVTSNLLDDAVSSVTYGNASDVGTLTDLGVSVNNDGSLTFDAGSLDSLLNTDYSGVLGFFQNANGWGQNFSTMLTNAGTSSPDGILALASTSNSNIESSLNAQITKENSIISAQQASLTAELNTANQILQQLPSQIDGVNELYSAITGYNQNVG